jgi:predicted ATP-dependent serine protease
MQPQSFIGRQSANSLYANALIIYNFWAALFKLVKEAFLPLAAAMAKKAEPASGVDGIAQLLRDVNRQFGEGALLRLGDAVHMEVEVLSTGSVTIDRTLGVGGLPRGRICEIYGPEASGKTTFCLSCIAAVQRNGGTAAFIDVEHALDPAYARVVGVRLEELLARLEDLDMRTALADARQRYGQRELF